MSDEKKGWGWPMNSKKAHYFVSIRSLCMRWMYSGKLTDDIHDSPDNCKACMKKREKMEKATQK